MRVNAAEVGQSLSPTPPNGAGVMVWMCRGFCTFLKKSLLGSMEKHCTAWAITQIPFGTHVLLLSASELLLSRGEKGALLAWSCWQWPSPVSPAGRAAVVGSSAHGNCFLLSLCAHAKTLQNQELWPSAGSDPCSSVSRVPGLLIALCRAIGSSASASDIRHFLWLNSSNSDTDLTFSRYLLRLENQKEQKNPQMQGLALGASSKLN